VRPGGFAFWGYHQAVLTLYDAARCPYAARVRIVLAEKGIAYEPVEIDLDDRPPWLYAKNPAGRVPVLEEDEGLVLAESRVIMEYLEERFPEPALLPKDAADRALARLAIERFDDFAKPYYDALWRGGPREAVDAAFAALDARLGERPYLSGAAYGLADIAYLPWIIRAEARLGADIRGHHALAAWFDGLAERRAVAEEIALVGAVLAGR
jgi:glutathione S-transferase